MWNCLDVPELAQSRAELGLIARDQIARTKQAALECREAEHVSKLGIRIQMSIAVLILRRQFASARAG